MSLEREKLTVSLGNLVKQWLLLIYDLYRQKFRLSSESNVILSAIASKSVLVNSRSLSLNFSSDDDQDCFQSESPSIVYGCPLGLLIASSEQLPLSIVIKNLEILLTI